MTHRPSSSSMIPPGKGALELYLPVEYTFVWYVRVCTSNWSLNHVLLSAIKESFRSTNWMNNSTVLTLSLCNVCWMMNAFLCFFVLFIQSLLPSHRGYTSWFSVKLICKSGTGFWFSLQNCRYSSYLIGVQNRKSAFGFPKNVSTIKYQNCQVRIDWYDLYEKVKLFFAAKAIYISL